MIVIYKTPGFIISSNETPWQIQKSWAFRSATCIPMDASQDFQLFARILSLAIEDWFLLQLKKEDNSSAIQG